MWFGPLLNCTTSNAAVTYSWIETVADVANCPTGCGLDASTITNSWTCAHDVSNVDSGANRTDASCVSGVKLGGILQ